MKILKKIVSVQFFFKIEIFFQNWDKSPKFHWEEAEFLENTHKISARIQNSSQMQSIEQGLDKIHLSLLD